MGDSSSQSFIAEARREQIIKASIETLDEIGYVKASLAKIAERARISTGLISYHFSDKDDLMNRVLQYLLEQQIGYIVSRVEQKESAAEKLIAFIEASLAYQGTHHANNSALIEIIFNARTPDNIPYYKMGDMEEDPLYSLLQTILSEGQETKQFADFDPVPVSMIIQGSIAESMLASGEKLNLELYTKQLVDIVLKIVNH